MTAPAGKSTRGVRARPRRSAGERVGVFGGTFDPVHYGHLRSVEEARETLALDRVILVPAADPPHKERSPISDPAHRCAMLRYAVRGVPGLAVSTVEINRPGQSFTIDTLRQLAQTHPDWQITLLMGADSFADISTWKEYAAIFAETDIAVFSRPGCSQARTHHLRSALPVAVRRDFRYSPDQKTLIHRTGKQVRFLTVSAFDISATDIRDRVRRGRSIRFLLPWTVERYIERHRLYRAGSRSR